MTTAVTSIFDLIAARLALITTTNGYNYTITNINRARLEPFKSEDLPAVNYWSTGLANTQNEYGDDSRELPVLVEAHTKTHDETFVDVASKLASDIVTALNRTALKPKVSDDPTYDFNGAVSDIVFEGYDHEIGEGQEPWCGVLVKFTIKYTTTIFNMASYSA